MELPKGLTVTVGHRTYKDECPDDLAPASIKDLIENLSKRNAKSEKALDELNADAEKAAKKAKEQKEKDQKAAEAKKKEGKPKDKKKKDEAPGFGVDGKSS